MMNKRSNIKIVLGALFFVGLLFVVSPLALEASVKDDAMNQLTKGAAKTELGNPDPRSIVGGIINVVLSTMGIVFLSLVVFAGYMRMTARGEEDRLTKSNKTMIGAVIGLAVVLLAYLITNFVVPRVYNAAIEEGGYDVNEQGPPSSQYSFPIIDL